ncbi:MAG: class I SAM-dependent methyltransferase [Actinomycetota bacterium]|nr:class I SAM-dependent methyltransferase [Actinomycetota bacterium]
MHESAYEHGRQFFEVYWNPRFTDVVELGSQDVNGSIRDHAPESARYLGLDMVEGKGVDLVVAPGEPLALDDEAFDVVVTSSAFEHDVCFWETFLDLLRITRPGGLLYVNAPSNNAFHRYPLDCWRFYPDSGVALVEWARRQDVEVELVESFVAAPEESGWCDFVAVFRKAGPPLVRSGRMAHLGEVMNVHDIDGPELDRESSPTYDMLRIDAVHDQLEAVAGQEQAARRELEEAHAAIAAAQARCDELEATTSALHVELANVYSSSSWKLTGAVRRLSTLARRR